MGKTYKNTPHDGHYRCCKGYKNAKINNARSIPPDGWMKERALCDINYIPWNAVNKMFDDGWPRRESFERVMKKFNLDRKKALEITNYYYDEDAWKPASKNKTPDGYLKVWRIKRVKSNKYK